MQNKSIQFSPEYIMDVLSRRRWFILIPSCLALIAGIALAVILPKVYESSTLILVQPQRVPSDYIQSIVTTDINARISTISQKILSRTNLEKVINDFDLFAAPGEGDLLLEQKIESLRKRISVNVTSSKDRRAEADSFSISFRGKDPQKVMVVTNALATYFIDANLKTREAQAIGTSDFLEDELESMRMRLAGLEQHLKDYRERNMGGLPEQLESNMRILDRLQEQLGITQQSLVEAKNRLALTERMISEGRAVKEYEGRTEVEMTTDPMRLRELLMQLQNKYTDKHPDVIKVKKMIADIAVPSNDSGKDAPSPVITPEMMQREETKREITGLKAEISALRAKIDHYQKLVENTPKREQELLSLKRDYDNIRATYNSLLERKLEAQLAVNMEKKQKGEQFYVLDTARIPRIPISPDMKKLFIIVLVAGLGAGGGLVFLLEYLDTSFRSREDVEATLALPVISVIPLLASRKRKIVRIINNIATICFVGGLTVLALGFTMIAFMGVEDTVQLVKRYVVI